MSNESEDDVEMNDYDILHLDNIYYHDELFV